MEKAGAGGSASRWGRLFGERAREWAETWEGPSGWGTPVYEHVLDRAKIALGSSVIDCGCGAGRFASIATERGASVAGIDASKELVAIATQRTPAGDFRVGDLEALPWPDDTFDVATGFSAFQFADDKAQALREARRVSRRLVAVVIPSRVSESGITAVFTPLFPLFPPEGLESMKQSGMFALSQPGKLEEALEDAGLTAVSDDEVNSPIHFEDQDTAARAFVGAGPMAVAIRHSGEQAVVRAVRDAIGPLTGIDKHVDLPAWYRVVLAEGAEAGR